jgi:hypothetical protein
LCDKAEIITMNAFQGTGRGAGAGLNPLGRRSSATGAGATRAASRREITCDPIQPYRRIRHQ